MRALRLLFGITIICTVAFGQSPGTDANIHSLFDVRAGMPRDKVIAALSERYSLKKSGLIVDVEYWDVRERESNGEFVGYVFFEQGRVRSVQIRRVQPLVGEAVRFADRLFRLLANEASPPPNMSDFARKLNVKTIKAEIQIQELHSDGSETLDMFITVGGKEFKITIVKGDKYASTVTVDQNIQ
jgi:hypothetical protein